MNKPAKLRFFNKETDSKAILSVYWSDRKGNTSPFLSVQIRSVKHNGLMVEGWREQKEALVSINKDFAFIVGNHLTNRDTGHPSHNIGNALYHFGLMVEQLANPPYTKEQQQQEIVELEKAFIMPENIKKGFGCNLHNAEKSIKRRTLEYFYYSPSWDKLEAYLLEVFQKSNNNGNFWKGNRDLKQLESWIETFRKNYQEVVKTKNKKAIDCSQVWSVEKFSKYYGLGIKEVQSLVFNENKKEILKEYLDIRAEAARIELETLTEVYNIPTIKA